MEAYLALIEDWAFSLVVEDPTVLPVCSFTILNGRGPDPFFIVQGI